MRKILFLILLLIFSKNAFALKSYAVDKGDGTFAILHVDENLETLEQKLKNNFYEGRPYQEIDITSIPSGKSDRKYWKPSGGKIVIDTVKKSQDEAEKLQKEQKKLDALAKLKITEQDLKDALYGLA